VIKFRSILFTIIGLALSLSLTGCKAALLDPKGIIANAEMHLLIDAVLLMLIVVIPVIILTGVIAWKYRAGNTKAKYTPDWSHSTLLEIIWWTIPCIIIAILATITWVSSHQLDPYRPLAVKTKPLIIQVVALNWKWLFIYPDQHVATVNFVQFPVNIPVRFLITADAPMNSFQIPQIAGQIYAMSGMQTKLNVMADTIGDYRGLSTNYSGEGFSNMYFTARVSTQRDFDKWVKQVQKSPQKLSMNAYNQLAQPSEDVPPEYFSGVTDGLYNTVIMKYMMPMKDMKNMQEATGTKGKGMADMKKMKSMNQQDKDYVKDRDYETRWHKGNIPPERPR
jgi:cytochrome o ubiquinol oxidase subunit 2